MGEPATYPVVPESPGMAPSPRSARPQAAVVPSLGIGSLRGSTTAVIPLDAYEPLLERSAPVFAPDDGTLAVADPRDGASDLRTDAPGSTPASGPPGQVLSIEECGPTVRVMRIGRPEGFTFLPGQYVKLGVPGGKHEDFSLASAPHDPHLELAIELRDGGEVTPALFALRVGDVVDISGAAKGKLLLDSSAAHHLMIATVTGIAPLISMVRDALHRGASDTFTVVLGASYAVELPFHAELAALAAAEPRLTYIPTVSRPDEPANHGWTGSTGRANAVVRELAGTFDAASTHVYAVGNPGMIQAVVGDLSGAGFAISTESYGS